MIKNSRGKLQIFLIYIPFFEIANRGMCLLAPMWLCLHWVPTVFMLIIYCLRVLTQCNILAQTSKPQNGSIRSVVTGLAQPGRNKHDEEYSRSWRERLGQDRLAYERWASLYPGGTFITTSPTHSTTASKLCLSAIHLQEVGASQSLANT